MFQTERNIEWGECDAMGIVFYPSFFKWMDSAFHAFSRSEGFDQTTLGKDYNLAGTPLVDAGCRFLSPGRFYEKLHIEVRLTKLGRSSLSLAYRFTIGETVVAEGHEARAFVAEQQGTIQKAEIPAAIRAKLEKHHV